MRLKIACVVDTDVLIDFLRNQSYAVARLNEFADDGLLAISALTQLEICQGMRSHEEAATINFLDGLTTIDVNASIARVAGRMLQGLRRRGITIGVVDGIIAATAQHLGVPLLTNNIIHYPFPDIKVIQGTHA